MKVYKPVEERYFKVRDVKEYLNSDESDAVDFIYDYLVDHYDEKISRWQIDVVLDVLKEHIDEKLTMYVESD